MASILEIPSASSSSDADPCVQEFIIDVNIMLFYGAMHRNAQKNFCLCMHAEQVYTSEAGITAAYRFSRPKGAFRRCPPSTEDLQRRRSTTLLESCGCSEEARVLGWVVRYAGRWEGKRLDNCSTWLDEGNGVL